MRDPALCPPEQLPRFQHGLEFRWLSQAECIVSPCIDHDSLLPVRYHSFPPLSILVKSLLLVGQVFGFLRELILPCICSHFWGTDSEMAITL